MSTELKAKKESIEYDDWKYEIDSLKEFIKTCPEDRYLGIDDLRDYIWYSLNENRWMEFNKDLP